MNKLKAGIIGIGFIGVAHIEALRRLGNIDIVAICDAYDIESKAENLHINHAYTNYREMIDNESLDAIHICTPNNTHYEISQYAIKKGIHVILEKPMTVTIEEARLLTELAKTYNVVAAVNFHNRMYPATAYIKKIIQENKIGDIFSIQGRYVQDWLLYQTDYSWRLNSATSGKTRAVADIGSHWLDLMTYMTGQKIVEVLAEFQTVYPKRKKATQPVKTFESNQNNMAYVDVDIDTEDIAIITFKTDHNALGSVYISQMAAGKSNDISFLISGKESSISWQLDDLEHIHIGHRDQANQILSKNPSLMSDISTMISYPAGHTEGFPDAFKQNFKSIYASICNHNKDNINYATFEDGYHQMILNEKIYESATKRKWVKINE